MDASPESDDVVTSFSFIDLFAGIGGTGLGFEAAGGECVFSSKWDKYAQLTYAANHGETPAGDITDIASDQVPEHDVLVAGFPCQPFSIAGVSKLKALGYEPKVEVIDAARVVPQHRERIYIVGFRDEQDRERFSFPEIGDRKRALREILDDGVDAKYTLTDGLWGYLQDYREKHRSRGNGFGFGLPDLDGVSRTLSARYWKDGSEILIRQPKENPRRLTPRECARLMGFPERFEIPVSDRQAYQQFGNSVAVPVVEEVARAMGRAMELKASRAGSYLRSWRPRD